VKVLRRTLIAILIVIVAALAIAWLILPTPLILLAVLLNGFASVGTPPGTLVVETRAGSSLPSPVVPDNSSDGPQVDANSWPSYNRTLSSERFSPLDQINTQNVRTLSVLCTYDTHLYEAFESGPIMVDGSLIATGAFDTFSINPSTCKQNWRTHENYQSQSPLLAARGAAYLDGRVFRGTLDGRVLAYDFKTGRRLWQTSVADSRFGTNICAAPIAWNGLVFVGIAGGDQKGIKGRMYALAADTGRVVWETYLVPRQSGDLSFGPNGRMPDQALDTWGNRDTPDLPISGGATWTSYTLDPVNGWLYVPVGNPSPDYADEARSGNDLFADSVLVLDAKSGNYIKHFQIAPRDWHDWDVSNTPALIRTRAGQPLVTFAPKDGYLYALDAASNELRYRSPVTRIENAQASFSSTSAVRFCPGSGGGGEWNGVAYDPRTNLLFTGENDWCLTATRQTDTELKADKAGAVWMGQRSHGAFDAFGKPDPRSQWGGWLYATDADSGKWTWRARSNYPTLSGVTPTAGGLVFFGDHGGNLYALNSGTGERLWSLKLRGAIAGGVISYSVDGSQRIAVTAGMTSVVWPTTPGSAKIVILSTRCPAGTGKDCP
jgi:alcohol dehydrogenase (cytochrome c)